MLAYIRYEDDASYAAAVHALGALNPGFLMIQDMDLGAAPLPVALVARLHREIPCFTWIKVETADRGRKLRALREATGPSLKLGTAGPDLIELLDRGVDSYLSTFSTEAYARIWSLHRAGRRDEAVAVYRQLLPALTFMATHQKIQWRFTKAILHARDCSPPRASASPRRHSMPARNDWSTNWRVMWSSWAIRSGRENFRVVGPASPEAGHEIEDRP
ncbi:MAG: hypothetical protein EXS32_14900 [Opitutus sp.]|nr:hypothetical protein [Opitutus sp.]